ncbi:MAG: methyltransferase domain-containing protein [Patescibacteria group bacterium]|nr:methyltransferase domain-containing protein [Patescibacteria group bacterium]
MIITTLIVLQYIFFIGTLAIMGYLAFIMLSFRNMVPYVPTPKRIILKMIELAGIKPHERVCDLGSGTGRIVIQIAKEHKENLVVGIEKSFFLRLFTRIRLLFHPFINRRIQIINQDFFNMEIFDFEVIFCFLTSEAMRRLTPKFNNLKSGGRVISYMFPIENASAFREITEAVTASDNIYVYQKI